MSPLNFPARLLQSIPVHPLPRCRQLLRPKCHLFNLHDLPLLNRQLSHPHHFPATVPAHNQVYNPLLNHQLFHRHRFPATIQVLNPVLSPLLNHQLFHRHRFPATIQAHNPVHNPLLNHQLSQRLLRLQQIQKLSSLSFSMQTKIFLLYWIQGRSMDATNCTEG